jgi:hypothetical protein
MIVWNGFGMFSCDHEYPRRPSWARAEGSRNVKSSGLPRHPMRLSMYKLSNLTGHGC